MKIGLIQMPVTASKTENIETAADYIAKAVSQGAELVVLPEMFTCISERESRVRSMESTGGEIWQFLSDTAKKHGIWLVGGSLPETEDGKLYNTCYVFDRKGCQKAHCRKIHMFDIDVHGGQFYRESDEFTPGQKPVVFETEWGIIGVCICFDMRFPLLALTMARMGAQAIVAPAAFNMTTGPVHWETMFRSRAIDNQLFTVGVSPARDELGPYVCYGHSIVCDSWGNVLYQAGADPAVGVVDVNLELNKSIRQQLPLLSSEREEIYKGCPFF